VQVSRSIGAKVVDRALDKALKLGPPSSGYDVTRDLPVPMRDGVTLLADHYTPTGTPRGTILVRSPYGRAGLFGLLYARPYAARGFHVVSVSCRATYGSGGEVNAFAGEVEDGADTVAWLRGQPWFTGSFATLGVSYLGLTQWAILMDPPPELRAAVIISGPHDTGRLLYASGSLGLLSTTSWTHGIVHQGEHGPLGSLLRGAVQRQKPTEPVLNGLPLLTAARAAWGTKAPWFEKWLDHPDPADGFWDSARVTGALDRTEIPVILHSGWQDLILEQVLESYQALHRRGVDVQLVVGPWNHGELASKGAGVVARDSLGWLAEHLAGDGERTSRSPVRIYVTGAEQWRDLPEWPPPTQGRTLHLQADGLLSEQAPGPDAQPSSFTYDPANPTPTVGGMTNALDAGRRDNTALESRSDVLTFTSSVLEHAVEVAGSPVLELAHLSDNPHADVFVRLCEVDSKGRSFNLSERFLRLDPARADEPLRLVLTPTAHRFQPGTRIRVSVSGGSFPAHDRNLGTGESPATGQSLKPSHRTITHADGASRLVLPVSAPA
jgi:putative CocE/NonD family hydrolase